MLVAFNFEWMSGSQITCALEEGLHEYQADELTSPLNQCLPDWHARVVRHIVCIYVLLNALQKQYVDLRTVTDLIWIKNKSTLASSVFLDIIRAGRAAGVAPDEGFLSPILPLMISCSYLRGCTWLPEHFSIVSLHGYGLRLECCLPSPIAIWHEGIRRGNTGLLFFCQ